MGQIQPLPPVHIVLEKRSTIPLHIVHGCLCTTELSNCTEAKGPTKPKILTIRPFTESLSTFDLIYFTFPLLSILLTHWETSNQKRTLKDCRPHPPSFFIYTYMLCFPHLTLMDGLSTCLLRLSPHLCTRPHPLCLFKDIAQKWQHLSLVHLSLSTRSFHQSTNWNVFHL